MKSFSQAPRIEACPASEALPHTRQADPGRYAVYGTILHAYLRDVNLLGAEAALAQVPASHRDAMAAIDLSKIPMADASSFVPELAVAWNPESGEAVELHRGTDSRDYSAAPADWWVGTMDLGGLSDTHVIVWDYKSGWKALQSPDEHLQLLGYAVALAALWGRDRAWVGFVRVPEGAEPRFVFAELELWDLDAAAERLKKVDEAIADAMRTYDHHEDQLVLTEGEHCTYCPAYSRCPAKAKLLGELVAATAAVEEGKDGASALGLLEGTLTTQNFGAVLLRWEMATKLLETVKTQLNQFAGDRYIPVGKGEVFGQVATTRETNIDLARAGSVIGAYGADVLEAAVERTEKITKSSLKEALRPWVAKRDEGKAKKDKLGITRAVDNLEEELRVAGAIRPSTTYSFRRHKPKPLAPSDQPEILQIDPNAAPKEK
jgi:hypothetical protein